VTERTAARLGAASASPAAAGGAAADTPTGAAADTPAGAAADTPTGDQTPKDIVTVRMPAESAYLSVLRTATAGLAARLDFTLDEIEDLRIAVDEACAMLLPQALPGTNLECSFELGGYAMSVAVAVQAENARPPSRDTFAWTVLNALAGEVDAYVGADEKVTIILQKSRDTSRDR